LQGFGWLRFVAKHYSSFDLPYRNFSFLRKRAFADLSQYFLT